MTTIENAFNCYISTAITIQKYADIMLLCLVRLVCACVRYGIVYCFDRTNNLDTLCKYFALQLASRYYSF